MASATRSKLPPVGMAHPSPPCLANILNDRAPVPAGVGALFIEERDWSYEPVADMPSEHHNLSGGTLSGFFFYQTARYRLLREVGPRQVFTGGAAYGPERRLVSAPTWSRLGAKQMRPSRAQSAVHDLSGALSSSIAALRKIYSITSSASASTLFGTVKSIALAVFKLMTNK